jgi:hypothetical protein
MALKPGRTQHARTVGHVSHDAQARIDKRVAKILAARDAALRLARARPGVPSAYDLMVWSSPDCGSVGRSWHRRNGIAVMSTRSGAAGAGAAF